ncbi:hypothetical protein CA262_08125 [Sphingobium sp. GW456-12-10-14-TSB1]|jgi:hypothetical protein|uniref:hypothetical protein n=1 Tax=Sphingobium sp. GW456-12-10-14-TSB1 TaxID=1987165 RepID=UPI000A381920|nr:hypothetical protein [Sphingobium sp. GW456-12-10-14-TSB1]OUC54824.1 hypothetical protein CA262_08125 [Sphingobium sp. GW456-12-10-14-TSB1]
MMTIQRNVLVVMRSSHLHTELVEVTAKVKIIGDAIHPKVQADLAAIERQARKALRNQRPLPGQTQPGFGPGTNPRTHSKSTMCFARPLTRR